MLSCSFGHLALINFPSWILWSPVWLVWLLCLWSINCPPTVNSLPEYHRLVMVLSLLALLALFVVWIFLVDALNRGDLCWSYLVWRLPSLLYLIIGLVIGKGYSKRSLMYLPTLITIQIPIWSNLVILLRTLYLV